MSDVMSDCSESQLVNMIMREVGKYGSVFRCNAGQFYTRSGRRVSGLPKGFSDIMLVMPGPVLCFIECKVGSNKPSDEQVAFIERMRSLGAVAGVVRSVGEALELCGLGAASQAPLP